MQNEPLQLTSASRSEGLAPTQLVAEACREIESIISDLDQFVQAFGQRMREWLAAEEQELRFSAAATEAVEEREQWELRRLIAEQKLRQQAQLLSAAWLQLEAEQRSLLQTKQGLALEMSSRLPGETTVTPESLLPRLPDNPVQTTDANCAVYSDFEQLRREVQASRAQQIWPRQHAQ